MSFVRAFLKGRRFVSHVQHQLDASSLASSPHVRFGASTSTATHSQCGLGWKLQASNFAAACTGFQEQSEEMLQYLLCEIDSKGDQHDLDLDVSFDAGVLTIDSLRAGTFVINKQTPNQEIWLSSPLSGPSRYHMAKGGEWINTRDGSSLKERLQIELNSIYQVGFFI